MPIYEYRCGACGHELEVLQKLSDPPLADCPECHKSSLTKLVSAAGFQLKGSGWYATDFRGSGKPAGKGNGAEGKTGEGESSKSGESKSESGDSKSPASAETSAPSGGCGGNCSCH